MENSPRPAISQMCGRSGSGFYKKSKRRVDQSMRLFYCKDCLKGAWILGEKAVIFMGLMWVYSLITR